MQAIIFLEEELRTGSSQNFVKELEKFPNYTEIYIYINCVGGQTGEAKNIRNFLINEKLRGINVITHAQSYCDSAAIIVFLCGQKRIIDKYNESFVVHKVRGGASGTYEEVRKAAEEIERIENELSEIYSFHIEGMTTERALYLMSREQSLNPEEVLKFGFATELNLPEYALNVYKALTSKEFFRTQNMSEEEIIERRTEYKKSVNMSFSELEEWSKTECSKLASNDRRPIQRNLELLETPAQDWTQKHYTWAGQTIAFIGRMKENLGGENIVKDKNGRECGTKAFISLKNWAYDPNKKSNKLTVNSYNMNLKTINRRPTLRDKANAALTGQTLSGYMAKKATREYWEFVKNENQKPKNMAVTLEDGTELYIFSDNQELLNKRVVIADSEGNPTEEAAPDGSHVLADGREISVLEGMIIEVKEAAENMEYEEQKKKEAMLEEEKKKAMEEEEKKKALEEEEKKKAENANNELEEIKKQLEAKNKELERLKNISSEGAPGTGTTAPKTVNTNKKMKALNLSFKNTKAKKAFEIEKEIQKKTNVNDIVFTGNDYVGEAALELLSKALLDSNDINYWTIMRGIKFEERLTGVDTEVTFQEPSAEFTPSGNDLSIDFERKLKPAKYEVHQQINYKDLRKSFFASALNLGSFQDYEDGSSQLTQFWLSRIVDKTAIKNAELRWKGKNGVTGLTFTDNYEGLIPRAIADPNVKKLSIPGAKAVSNVSLANPAVVTVGSTAELEVGNYVTFEGIDNGGGTLGDDLNGETFLIIDIDSNGTDFSIQVDTSAAGGVPTFANAKVSYINETNIIQSLSLFTGNIPEQLRYKDDWKIFIPLHLADYYYKATASVATGSGQYYIGKRELEFLDNALAVVNHMPRNLVWGNHIANQFLGLDLETDEETVRVVDFRQTKNSDILSAKISMKADTNYKFASECLLMK